MNSWEQLQAEIDRQSDQTTLEPDRDVTDVFFHRISKGGSGVPNDNQIFTTWFFGGGDVTYLADWCYFLMTLAQNEAYSLEKLRKMTRFWVMQPSEFGNYCGLTLQWQLVQRFDALLDDLDRTAFVALLDSLRAYYCNLNVWVYQYLPWGLGYAFPRKDEAYFQKALALTGLDAPSPAKL